MVLSDIEIKAEINAQRLIFDPPIPASSSRIGSTSIDLLLHEELILVQQEPVEDITVNPSSSSHVMNLLSNYGTIEMLGTGRHRMSPYNRIVGKTLESIQLPNHIAGRIEGKSSLARLGLAVHVTAPTVLAGFKGNLYLEMYNYGPFHIDLFQGMEIAQLVLDHVGLPALRGYEGRYQDQR